MGKGIVHVKQKCSLATALYVGVGGVILGIVATLYTPPLLAPAKNSLKEEPKSVSQVEVVPSGTSKSDTASSSTDEKLSAELKAKLTYSVIASFIESELNLPTATVSAITDSPDDVHVRRICEVTVDEGYKLAPAQWPDGTFLRLRETGGREIGIFQTIKARDSGVIGELTGFGTLDQGDRVTIEFLLPGKKTTESSPER